jgi:hypothetical protein
LSGDSIVVLDAILSYNDTADGATVDCYESTGITIKILDDITGVGADMTAEVAGGKSFKIEILYVTDA